MGAGIWVMDEGAVGRSRLSAYLRGGEFLKRRQVVAAAGRHKLRNRFRLRQMDQQALGSFLVLGEVPDAPEVRKERSEPAFGTHREAVRPALLGDLRRVTFGACPGAWRIHDQGASAGNQPLVV